MISLSTGVSFILMIVSSRIMRRFSNNVGFLNPLSIFFGVWFLCLILYEMDAYLHYFLIRMSGKADVWLSIAFVSFFIGSVLWIPFLKKENMPQRVHDSLEFKIMWVINGVLFFLFFFAVMWKIHLLTQWYGGFFCALNKIKFHESYEQITFPYFLYFFTLPAYLLIINLGILTFLQKSKMAVLLAVCTLVLAFLDSSTVGMRGGILNFSLLYVCAIMVSLIALEKKIRIRHYLWIGCAAGGIIFLLALSLFLRTVGGKCAAPVQHHAPSYVQPSQTTSVSACNPLHGVSATGHFVPDEALIKKLTKENGTHRKRLQMEEAFFKYSFLYIVGTFPAYSYFLEHPFPTYYWGMWTFHGVYHALHYSSSIFKTPVLSCFDTGTYYAPVLVTAYNSTNYLTYLDSDFGHVGMIIGSLLVGLISTCFFVRVLRYRTIQDMQFLVLILFGLITSIRGILTNGVFCWIVIALIIAEWGIARLWIKCRKK